MEPTQAGFKTLDIRSRVNVGVQRHHPVLGGPVTNTRTWRILVIVTHIHHVVLRRRTLQSEVLEKVVLQLWWAGGVEDAIWQVGVLSGVGLKSPHTEVLWCSHTVLIRVKVL